MWLMGPGSPIPLIGGFLFLFFLKGTQLESDLFLIYLFLVLLGLGCGPQAQ